MFYYVGLIKNKSIDLIKYTLTIISTDTQLNQSNQSVQNGQVIQNGQVGQNGQVIQNGQHILIDQSISTLIINLIKDTFLYKSIKTQIDKLRDISFSRIRFIAILILLTTASIMICLFQSLALSTYIFVNICLSICIVFFIFISYICYYILHLIFIYRKLITIIGLIDLLFDVF